MSHHTSMTRVPRKTVAAADEPGSDAAARKNAVPGTESSAAAAPAAGAGHDRAGHGADRDWTKRPRPVSQDIQLTAHRLFGGLFLLFVAMIVSYMAGVIMGRQQLDQELLLARSMPGETAEGKADASGGSDAASETKDAAQTKKAGDAEEEETKDGHFSILKPQELAFSRFLRAAPGEKVQEPRSLEIYKPIVLPTTNSTLRTDVPLDVPMAPGMSPATAGGGPPQKPEQAADLYDFVFQVAAFRSAQDAEETRIQLEAEGFRSRLEISGRLHLVLLLSRGPLSRIQEIMEVTERLHLGRPIERSRKAVLRPIGVR